MESERVPNPPAAKPLLAVDVDGVISLFGFDVPPPASVCEPHLIDGSPHFISTGAGQRLRQLADSFDPVWATGWQERANDRLPLIIGFGPLPVIRFDPREDETADECLSAGGRPAGGESLPAGGGSDLAATTPAHWKLAGIDAFSDDRALAWIDDSFDQSCFEWAKAREHDGLPTLLVPTEPTVGLEQVQVEVMEAWAAGLSPAAARD